MSHDMKVDTHQIRMLRETRGWSQEQLATISGLSPRTIQRMETDGRASGESRMAVASALGVEPMQLATATTVSETTGPTSSKTMSPADRTKIVLWIVSLVLAVMLLQLIFAHQLGKSSGERNARVAATCKANPDSESCRR